MYILLCIIAAVIGITVYYIHSDFDQFIINYTVIIVRYRLKFIIFKRLYKQLGWRACVKMIASLTRDTLYRWCGGSRKPSVVKNGKIYTLTYVYGMRTYKIRWEGKLGPQKIISITDKSGKNVTNNVRPFLGPSEKFHGSHLSPKTLGYEKLIFKNINAENRTFEGDQIIILA